MAVANIKKVTTSAGTHDVEALHFITGSLDTPAQWKSYIDSLVGQGLQIVIDTKHASKEEPATTASASTMGKLYLVTLTGQLVGSYTEFVTVRTGTEGAYTYTWERIGTTEVDLSNYMKYNTQFDNAALSNGDHTHTVTGSVTVPTVSHTDKKLSASATQGAVTQPKDEVLGSATTFTTTVTPAVTNIKATASGTDLNVSTSDTYIKSYAGATSKLAQTSVIPAVANGTASKATAGTAKTFLTAAIKDASCSQSFNTDAIKAAQLNLSTTSETGREAIVTAVGDSSLTGTTTFNTDAIKSATCSQSFLTSGLASATFTPSVDANGILSFSFSTTAATPTAVSISTAAAGTGTVGISSGAVTTKYAKVNTTSATSAAVSISTTAADATDTITPYSFSDVNVATVGDAVTVATGSLSTSGTGSSVMTGLGTATTGTPVSAVSIKTQPTISLATGATAGTGVISVATGITSAATSASGDMVNAVTSVSVANPTVTLSAAATGDVDVVSTMEVGTTSASLASGSAASAGAHTHNVKATK